MLTPRQRWRVSFHGIRQILKSMSTAEFYVAGADPRRTYLAVPQAVEKVLKKAGLGVEQIDLIEIQEAFAAQVLADIKMMNLTEKDFPRINVNGSGISLGHPIACTGTRVLVTLLHEMERRNSRYGLECICGGGGLGFDHRKTLIDNI
jgi:acetyl-CoA C-acetyltransferase